MKEKKKTIQEVKLIKENLKFMHKRCQILRWGWRSGVLGANNFHKTEEENIVEHTERGIESKEKGL